MLMLKMADEVFIIPISFSIHFQVSLYTHMNHALATNTTNICTVYVHVCIKHSYSYIAI